MNHVVFFSSGVASWAAAKRVAIAHGTDKLILLFADTKIEDEDNYRFLHEAAANVGGKLEIVCDGRTPWEVFKDKRWLSHRGSACSKELKQNQCRQFLENHPDLNPENTVLYVGIDWQEYERMEAIKKGWHPWKVEAPLCFDPWLDRKAVFDWLKKEGLSPPRLYQLGFAHANCGGFCVKAGKAQYANLLKHFPDRYKYHEQQEQGFRESLERHDIGILREQKDNELKILSLAEFRERIESAPKQLELFDWGGCGCFIQEEQT